MINRKSLEMDDLEKVTGGKGKCVIPGVAGGAGGAGGTGEPGDPNQVQTRKSDCPVCGVEREFYLYSGGRALCSKCSFEKFL